jgi:hypothetical protein
MNRYLVFIIASLTFFCFTLCFTAKASANSNCNPECIPGYECVNGICTHPNLGDGPVTFSFLEGIFSNILGIVVMLAGLAVFIMLLKGGFTFLTSGGDPQKGAGAKNTITWAVIGLVALLSIWFILSLISEFTGVDTILKFEIPR